MPGLWASPSPPLIQILPNPTQPLSSPGFQLPRSWDVLWETQNSQGHLAPVKTSAQPGCSPSPTTEELGQKGRCAKPTE